MNTLLVEIDSGDGGLAPPRTCTMTLIFCLLSLVQGHVEVLPRIDASEMSVTEDAHLVRFLFARVMSTEEQRAMTFSEILHFF